MEEKKITNPVKAIRAMCLDCCCGSTNEIKLCTATRCPLYPFREGANPYRTPRQYTEEQKAALASRLRRGKLTSTGDETENGNG